MHTFLLLPHQLSHYWKRQLKYEKEKGEAVLFGLELEKSTRRLVFIYMRDISLLFIYMWDISLSSWVCPMRKISSNEHT